MQSGDSAPECDSKWWQIGLETLAVANYTVAVLIHDCHHLADPHAKEARLHWHPGFTHTVYILAPALVTFMYFGQCVNGNQLVMIRVTVEFNSVPFFTAPRPKWLLVKCYEGKFDMKCLCLRPGLCIAPSSRKAVLAEVSIKEYGNIGQVYSFAHSAGELARSYKAPRWWSLYWSHAI